jgi:hypothetical protein
LSDPATDDEHWPTDGILEIRIIYIYVSLKNNVVIKKNVNENARKAAKTMWIINCAKFNDCILWIQPWLNERQRSVNDFWSCILGNHTSDKLSLVIKEFLATFIGKTDCNTLPAPWWKWASTERQRFLFIRPGKSLLRLVVVSLKGIFGCVYRQNRLQYTPCPIMKMSVNGASTICGHTSWDITPPISCR